MRIAVTGANGHMGQRILNRLTGTGHARTALVREETPLPATDVIADWTHSGAARDALASADAVVHLAGALAPKDGDYAAANIAPTRIVVDAVRPKTPVVFLSYPGASPEATNRYLRAKGVCEQMLRDAAPATVFRCTHIVGDPAMPGPTAAYLLSRDGAPVTVLGNGQQRVAPVCAEHVADAVLAALDRPADGVFELAGPDKMTMDELVALLNAGRDVPVRHIRQWVARLASPVVPGLNASLLGVMCGDSLGDASAARETFGVSPLPLASVWPRPPAVS
jgi:uncharacterized protein YbjT (DUF2867 family)